MLIYRKKSIKRSHIFVLDLLECNGAILDWRKSFASERLSVCQQNNKRKTWSDSDLLEETGKKINFTKLKSGQKEFSHRLNVHGDRAGIPSLLISLQNGDNDEKGKDDEKEKDDDKDKDDRPDRKLQGVWHRYELLSRRLQRETLRSYLSYLGENVAETPKPPLPSNYVPQRLRYVRPRVSRNDLRRYPRHHGFQYCHDAALGLSWQY